MKRALFGLFSLFVVTLFAQEKPYDRPLVNQLGYNKGEAKHFVAYGVKNNTPFEVINVRTKEVEYTGRVLGHEGWMNDFNPSTTDEYIVRVNGKESVPFWIADHLMEKLSSKLAYDFFIDVRGSKDPVNSNEINVYGGGPSRDSGAFGLETLFELLFYASNPALFDNWTTEMQPSATPDLIDIILWHAEFAYHHKDFNQKVGNRHGTLGYRGTPRMEYDFWNTLDQLAPVCAAYHTFLKPYLSKERYQAYRKACLERWTKYDRHKVVRYWTHSTKWVDAGFQEFNEMGNVYGQSVFSNLFMYLCEKNEPDGHPEQFLKWAQESTEDIIQNWDFKNPRHMWWIRNGEHITPQALAFFLMVAPDKAPRGTKEKLLQWSVYFKQRTNNCWKYRSHSDTEMAHTRTKELGNAALGGSAFVIAHLLGDQELRNIGWAQVDQVFGANPVGAHWSNKSPERVEINGFWEGVENGWPQAHPNGYGKLGLVRGTLDGSPLDSQFPHANSKDESEVKASAGITNKAYATEGWSISNRGWMSTLTFSTLGSHQIKVLATPPNKVGNVVVVRLKAALNIDWEKRDKGWIDVRVGNGLTERVSVLETEPNSGLFEASYTIPKGAKGKTIHFSYGYWGFEKTATVDVLR